MLQSVHEERQEVRDALDESHAADAACIAALDQGATLRTSNDTASVEHLLKIYARRVEHLTSRNARTVGSDEVIGRLRSAVGPLRIASVDDPAWHFVVFLDAATGGVVSSWGVDAQLANASYEA